MKRPIFLFGLFMVLTIPGAMGQQACYSQANLVSNTPGVGETTDIQPSDSTP